MPIPPVLGLGGFIDPRGDFYPNDDEGHGLWAIENASAIGRRPEDFVGPDASFDALSAFLRAGWLRVPSEGGVHVDRLTKSNVGFVKAAIRAQAKTCAIDRRHRDTYARAADFFTRLYVDVGVGGDVNQIEIRVDRDGEPDDLDKLDALVEKPKRNRRRR